MDGFARIALLVYGVGMFLGGLMGYVKGHSLFSLISGIASVILLSIAFSVAPTQPKVGYGIGIGTAAILACVFVERLVKTGKVMPSAMLIGLSVLAVLVFVAGLNQSRGK